MECATVPKLEWSKDGVAVRFGNNFVCLFLFDLIFFSSDYVKSFENGIATLTIEETFADDSAKYSCKATTEAGEAETAATLQVKGEGHLFF